VITDAVRIRVIRALLGISSKDLARRVGVTQGVVTGWEKGRYCPQRKNRAALAQICEDAKIMFMPNGMPCPSEGFATEKENTSGGTSIGDTV
jgi:ribosome-binding protein aMBF1 (putative translation factor)